MGNCGSPIECDAGWLLLTHGAGAMRKYSTGAALLDRDDPSRILGRIVLPDPRRRRERSAKAMCPMSSTCGAMRVGDELFIPFGISDSAIGFATASIDDLLRHLA